MKWAPQFEEELNRNHREKLRKDIIVHDLQRLNEYPNSKPSKGISSWFRAALVGTYHKGALIWLGGNDLAQEPDGQWRYRREQDQTGSWVRADLLGKMPYEFVGNVNWEGDPYYHYPHLFCRFAGPGRQPYEEVVFAEARSFDSGRSYYSDLALAKSVKKRSEQLGFTPYRYAR